MKPPKSGLPENFIAKLNLLFPRHASQILETFTKRRPTTLRVNTLKIDDQAFLLEAKERGVIVKRIVENPRAYILESPTLREFTEMALYTSGKCYIQSLSSMIPPIVLDPRRGETILDIAAAPGSKTTQMAALMENSGKIIANDSSHIRIYKLEANLKMQGVTNVSVRKGLGQVVWEEYRDYFDKTLVDAPCSMEGRFFVDDPKTYEHWSTGKVKELSHTQRFLLRSALSATKPGGTIVYSTCTLSPEENEGVIAWLLEKEPHAFTVEPIDLPSDIPTIPGITQWKERRYPQEVTKTVRILPNDYFEAFYVAKLKKVS